jgi:small-conductance mechanosensitive channel
MSGLDVLAVGVLDGASEALGGFLPRLAGALVLLVVGLLVARLAARLVRGGLARAGLDSLGERLGGAAVLERAGLERSLSALTGRAVRIGLVAVTVFAALSLLGLQFLSDSLNQAVLFLPNLAVAALLLLVGVVLGGIVRERTDRVVTQMDLPVPLGRAAQIAVVAVFAITAAAQIAVSTAILLALVGIVLAGVAATFALAFGLGGRDVASQLTAGRYLRSAFAADQEISVAGVRGRIVAVETAATVLATDSGDTVRVPNDTLLGSIVTVHGPDAPGHAPSRVAKPVS